MISAVIANSCNENNRKFSIGLDFEITHWLRNTFWDSIIHERERAKLCTVQVGSRFNSILFGKDALANRLLESTVYIESVPSLLLNPKTIYLDTSDGNYNHDTQDSNKSEVPLSIQELYPSVPRISKVLDSITVLRDYIAHLIQKILLHGRTVFPSQFHSNYLQWVISVPLYFTHSEKSLLRQVCFQCGMISSTCSDQLILISDAEACLVHVQKSFSLSGIVTVCDFGYSESTLSTYQYYSENDYIKYGPNGRISIGSGSLENKLIPCFLRRYYEQKDQPRLMERLYEKINQAKYSFGKQNQELQGTLNIKRKKETLYTKSDICDWFQEYSRILYSIDQFMKKTIKNSKETLTLVCYGGICRSMFIQNLIKEYFQSTIVKVIIHDPYKAIVKGASFLGAEKQRIEHRIYRYSYGTQFSKPFDPEKDDPNVFRWGKKPNQFIASYLPFTIPHQPIPKDKLYEQMVCPANDQQYEFPFGLYYSKDESNNMQFCRELIKIIVEVPEGYRHLGRQNRFRILMNFQLTEIQFSVLHLQSGKQHDSIVVL